MTFAAAPHALQAAERSYVRWGTQPYAGPYMTQGTGSIVGVGPLAVVGVMTFDGKGTGALASTVKLERRDF